MDRDLTLILKLQDEISKDLKKVSASIDSSGNSAKTSGVSMKGLLATIGGVTAAYAFLKNGVIDSVAAYNKQTEIETKLQTIIMNHKGATLEQVQALKDQADALQKVGVVSAETVMSAQAQLATFDLMPATIQKIIPGFVDMMVAEKGMNATAEDAKNLAQGLGKAFQGQYEMLTKQGFVITDAQKKMIAFGDEQMKGKAISEILGRTYDDLNKKMLDTFGGRLQWAKNNLGELQQEIGGGIATSILEMIKGLEGGSDGLLQFVDDAKRSIAVWVPALIFGFKTAGSIFVNFITLVGQFAGDFINIFISIGNDLNSFFSAMQNDFIQFGKGIGLALIGHWDEATQAFQSMSLSSFTETKSAFGTMGSDMSATINNFSTILAEGMTGSENATASMLSGIKDLGKGAGASFGNAGDAASAMADKIDAAKKKIADLQKAMKKAISSAKDDIKKFKDEFNDTELKKQQDFQDSVAQIIVDKQNELVDLKKTGDSTMTDSEKVARDEQIKTIDAFLAKHLQDTVDYATQIQAIKDFAALDEIEQLKFTFAAEKKIRLADYEDQLSDLKNHLKDVEKEYKDKLKELRADLKKELGNITISVDVATASTKKRALGGPVTAGQPYIVGERQAELFVPDSNGRIVPSIGSASAMPGGGSVIVNISGNTLLDSRAAEKIGDLIVQRLKLNYQQ